VSIQFPEQLLPDVLPRTVTIQNVIADLTPTQRNVLAHLVEGKSNKEIGLLLARSEKTIKAQITAMLKRLDCNSRLQIVVRYYKGLLA
jgi:DNA-binding NarL/FixJ family response regulator